MFFDTKAFKKIQQPKFRYALSVVVSITVVLLALGLFFWLVLPEMINSITHFMNNTQNYATNIEDKLKDLLESFAIAYKSADYIEINVSCPNTGESRVDLDMSFSERIFTEIMNFRNGLGLRKAVYAKLSPDLSERHLISIMDMLVRTGVNGVVIGNTYPTAKLSELPVNAKFEDLTPLRADGDCGGMSGRPLFENMVWNVKYIREHYPQMSIIACGGIDHGYKIYDLIKLGVDAVQCYSVVAFRWMAAHAMRNELMDAMLNDGYKSLGEYDDRNPRK